MVVVAVIGFTLALFLVYKFGSLLSGELFHYFYAGDDERRPGVLSSDEIKNVQSIFFNTVYTLLGALAKSDGHIAEVEVDVTEAYMEKMDLDKTRRQEAITLFKHGASAQFDLQGLISSFLPLSQRNANLTEILLVYMVNLARMDGVLVDAEQKLLHQVATGLGYTSIAFDHLLRMIASQNRFVDPPPNVGGANAKAETKRDNYETQSNDLDAAYEALGVTAAASDEDIKKAYRRLVNQFHPDKLMGQGLPDFMVRAATEHTKKIHAAYNYIKKHRKAA